VLGSAADANAVDPLAVDWCLLKSTEWALAAQDRALDARLYCHIRSDHDGLFDGLPKTKDLRLIVHRPGYEYYAGNDELFGGEGDDLLLGDQALIVLPALHQTPDSRMQADELNRAVDRLLGTAAERLRDAHADGIYGHDFHSGEHGQCCGCCCCAKAERNVYSGADRIEGEGGDDVAFGDNATVKPVFSYRCSTVQVSLQAQPYGPGGSDCDHGHFALRSGDDRIAGGAGRDVLYGQEGCDRLYGGADNDVLLGGSGEDALFGEDGADRLYGGSHCDWLDGGPGCDILKQGDGGEDPDGDGWTGVQVIVGNPWLERLLQDIAASVARLHRRNWVELVFNTKCSHCCHN
jgi:Ca2+-binding RTX toxin-like protein